MAARNHRPGRIFEWFAHLNSIGWGIMLAIPGISVEKSHSFRGLIDAGWTAPLLSVFLSISGVVGCMALWVNGSKPYGSPRFRAAAAGAGCFVYAQAFGSLARDFLINGQPAQASIMPYGLMALFCIYACYQSSRDAAPRT